MIMTDCIYAAESGMITESEIAAALEKAVGERELSKVLIIPPDFTRLHSQAGIITRLAYHILERKGCEIDIMPALGTHEPMTREQAEIMFGDLPFERFIAHNWRTDVVRLGEVPGEYIAEVSGGVWTQPVAVELNKRLVSGEYDLIISPGQVVPHEVVGMANHAKNLFVGVGGSEMINKSHMLGASYGMERMMGRTDTPVRAVFDYALEHFLADLPVLFVLTVCTDEGMHGLFIGEGRECYEKACELAAQKNIYRVKGGIDKCVVWLDPGEFRSTWLGNKSVYRTRMAINDGGELIVLAPGVRHFGEDEDVDVLIRKYGYRGTPYVMSLTFGEGDNPLAENMGTAAHLIHGSSEGRFKVTYAVQEDMREQIEQVGYASASIDEMLERYPVEKLSYGINTLEDGEEIFFIPNPALGLWMKN